MARPEEEKVTGPSVPRGEMPSEGVWSAGVCYFTSPDTFYICPSERIALYTQIKALVNSSSLKGCVNPVLGTCCLVKHQQEYFRAEITQLRRNQKVSLFLIDYGKSVVEDVCKLRPLSVEA